MKENKRDRTRKEPILKKALGIIVLTILTLVTVAGAAPNAYITNDITNTVNVLDTATNTVIANVNAGLSPYGVAVNPAGTKVYVGCWNDGFLYVINTATNSVTAKVYIGYQQINSVAVSPDGTKVYATKNDNTNSVYVIDTSSNNVMSILSLGDFGGSIAFNPMGTRVYVGSAGGKNSVYVIDTATNKVIATVPVGLPDGIIVNPAGTRVYTANVIDNTFSIIDTATNTVTAIIPVDNKPYGVAVNPTGTRLWVVSENITSVFDTTTNALIAKLPVGGFRGSAAFTPDGKKIYVVGKGNVSIIDSATNTISTTLGGIVGNSPPHGQFIVPPSPNPTTVSFNPQNVELHPGSSQTIEIVMNRIPTNGLAGSNITVTISDPTVANITAVFPPTWAGVSNVSSVPSSSIWIKAANFAQVHANDTNVSLGSINITGIKAGNSSINLVPSQIDDNNGNPINPIVNTGKVTVVLIPLFPNCTNPPKDPDNDGLYEDINGNGRLDFADIVIYFNNMTWITQNSLTAYFDFNRNGRIDFNDVVLLFNEIK